MKVLPEGRTALVLTQTPRRFEGGRWTLDPSVLAEVDLDLPDRRAAMGFHGDHQATALDADGDFVYVTFNSGELVLRRAEDGAVHARQELRVNGHRVVPLSLVRCSCTTARHDDLDRAERVGEATRLSPGRLAIGTLDGRVLVCSLAASPDLARKQESRTLQILTLRQYGNVSGRAGGYWCRLSQLFWFSPVRRRDPVCQGELRPTVHSKSVWQGEFRIELH
ncbi:hypothetical protein ABZ807_28890 [Micromonospora sp. NPDC047548]|uniref:hypothetical protein n=1 Tax=Micromonospora sp. NPDC047548 TaxID=3155624 RepID=UPI0033E0856B